MELNSETYVVFVAFITSFFADSIFRVASCAKIYFILQYSLKKVLSHDMLISVK